MENLSLTDIIQETLAVDPAADNPAIEEVESIDDTESLVDELINGIDDEDIEDEGSDAETGEDSDLERYKVKVDGEVVEVTVDELKSGYQRQADYTRKAQALAAEKQEFEQVVGQFGETLQTLQQLDSAWDENPVQVLAHFTANTENPTQAVALLIKELATAGMLERDFMEMFGITPDVRQGWSKESEVNNLKKRVSQTETEQSQKLQELAYEQEVQKALAEYESQVDEILESEGLDLTVKQRNAFRSRLAQYAHDNELTNLKAAYKALKYEDTQKKRALAEKSAARAKQKKNASVVGRASSGAKGSAPVEDNTDLSSVIRAAMQEAQSS